MVLSSLGVPSDEEGAVSVIALDTELTTEEIRCDSWVQADRDDLVAELGVLHERFLEGIAVPTARALVRDERPAHRE